MGRGGGSGNSHDPSGRPWFDPSKEDLIRFAEECRVRYDLPPIMNTEPNRAMLVALFIAVFVTAIVYALQKYGIKEMVPDVISGGNEIMPTLVILAIAWPLAAVSQELGMNVFIKDLVGSALPGWSVAVTLFILSASVTYFIGSGWGSASLIMPFAIPLAVTAGAGVPLCVAAVITGGTFGGVEDRAGYYESAGTLRDIRQIHMVACGTAYHACLVG